MTLTARPLPVRALPPRRSTPAGLAQTNAALLRRRDVGRSAALFEFDLDQALTGYLAGQYVALGLPTSSGLIQRPYSIVSINPARTRIELLIRRVDGGALTPRLWQLAAGTRLRLGPPRGTFTLRGGERRHHLFVGAGTGIAPLLALVAECAVHGDGVAATLIHGVSYAGDLVFQPRIAGWRAAGLDLDYRPTVSRPGEPHNAGWTGPIGRAENELERLTGRPGFRPERKVAYVCGNPAMVGATVAVLAYAGLPDEAIHIERF